MQEYVLGFMFDDTAERVLLIRKNRPSWQAGLLNGIGGHIEPGELPIDAMIREFREETGASHDDWRHYLVLEFPKGRIYCYAAQNTDACNEARTMTDEPLVITQIAQMPHDVLDNIRWMIPMALDRGAHAARVSSGGPTPDWFQIAA